MATKTLAQRLAENAAEAAALKIEQAQAVKAILDGAEYAAVIDALNAVYVEGLGSAVNASLSRVKTTLADLVVQADATITPPPVVTPAAP